MLDTLSDREEFWTKYPVPSIAISARSPTWQAPIRALKSPS